jgi:predicted ATPase
VDSDCQGAQERHAAYFVALAERAETAVDGRLQAVWLDLLEYEQGNLRSAMRWAIDAGRAELALRLGSAVWRFWETRGYLTEGLQWFDEAQSHSDSVDRHVRAKALTAAGGLARARADLEHAASLHEASAALFREIGDRRGIALALRGIGVVARDRGDYATAKAANEESLALSRELGDKSQIGLQGNIGESAEALGDAVAAAGLYRESLATSRALGYKPGIVRALFNLARIAADRAEWVQVFQLCDESLILIQDLGTRRGLPDCLELVAEVAHARGQSAAAAQLVGASEALRQAGSIAPVAPVARERRPRLLRAIHSSIPKDSFSEAWQRGESMSVPEAIAFARGIANG